MDKPTKPPNNGLEINKIILEGENTKADIVLGLDMNLFNAAENSDLFVPHNIKNINKLCMENDLPYWGFYNNYYYYYGIPHMYPWWYYYTLMPHYTYSVHTHVSIHCNNGYYVNKPRGPKFNNNKFTIFYFIKL